MKLKLPMFVASALVVMQFFGTVACRQVRAGASSPETTSKILFEDFVDTKRQRTLPAKIYMPATLDQPAPVVIFSHGLGGSREAAPYLGRYWADHGYIGVFIQHPGSDESFWKPGLAGLSGNPGGKPTRELLMPKFKQQLTNPMHAVNRAQDVHFVIDKLTELNNVDRDLKGKLDLGKLAIAGHSFGSWTALTASGQAIVSRSGETIASGDPRIKAAIYLSPTAPNQKSNLQTVYGGIKIPGLHFTGTKDNSPVNNTKAEDRRIAFDNIRNSDQYLIILNNADHMVFGAGRHRRVGGHDDENQQSIVQNVSTKFLDAYLKSDKKALTWLTGSGAKNLLSGEGTLEFKVASAATR